MNFTCNSQSCMFRQSAQGDNFCYVTMCPRRQNEDTCRPVFVSNHTMSEAELAQSMKEYYTY